MDTINTMGIMRGKKLLRIFGGVVGLLGTVSLACYQSQCLCVIFLTPSSEGNGDYYDAFYGGEPEVSLVSIFLWLIPVSLQFYPWLKQFTAMIRNHDRKDYYGLFVAKGTVTRGLSVLLTIINIGTIILLSWALSADVDRIQRWNYIGEDGLFHLCPNISFIYLVWFFYINTFWSFVYIAHGIYHHNISKNRKHL